MFYSFTFPVWVADKAGQLMRRRSFLTWHNEDDQAKHTVELYIKWAEPGSTFICSVYLNLLKLKVNPQYDRVIYEESIINHTGGFSLSTQISVLGFLFDAVNTQ